MKTCDILIIGGGPAGLFCAKQLRGADVLILEKGMQVAQRVCPSPEKCLTCKTCFVISGVGGAGMFSDGKMNFSKKIGGDVERCFSDENYEKIASGFIDEYAIAFNEINIEEIKRINSEFSDDIYFLHIDQIHLGSDFLPEFINQTTSGFSDRIITDESVKEIVYDSGASRFKVRGKHDTYQSEALVVATGQAGSHFAAATAKKFKVSVEGKYVDLGVRLEVPEHMFADLVKVQYDPKIYLNTSAGVFRTYCSNPKGYVLVEQKGDIVSVNGHAKKEETSQSSNFALMLKTSRLESSDLLHIVGSISHKLKKPLLQSVSDFMGMAGEIHINPDVITCKNYHMGNLNDFYPSFFCAGLKEALGKLDLLIPGLLNSDAVLYAPEYKLYGNEIHVSKDSFACSFPGLYFIGDCCGAIHGLLNAIYSGISCGNSLKNEKW